jgi:hypothetical protein
MVPESNERWAWRTRLLRINCCEQLHGARRWRTQRSLRWIVSANLAHKIIAPGKFAVASKRLFDAIGVAAAQRPGGVPRQQSFNVVALWLFIDHVHGQPLSIPCALSSPPVVARVEHARLDCVLRSNDLSYFSTDFV